MCFPGAALVLRIWCDRPGRVLIPDAPAGVAGTVGAPGALLLSGAVLLTAA